MKACVFCKLVNGELPMHKVYENDHVLAFMDIQPITPGHVVVISKTHEEQVWNLDDTHYNAMMRANQTIAKRIQAVLGSFRVGLIIEGMDVAHAHSKLVPIKYGMKKTLNEQVIAETDHAALAAMAEKLSLI